jgi:membrane protein
LPVPAVVSRVGPKTGEMGTLARVRDVGGTVVEVVREENVPLMAAGIAYYAFASLLPLLLLVLLVAALVDRQGIANRVVDAVSGFAPAAGGLLEAAIESAGQGTGVSVIGVVVLLWGALKVFRGLDTAFSEIYDTSAEVTVLDQLRDGLVVLASLGLALAATVAVGVVVTVVPLGQFARFAPIAVLLIGLALAFFPMYYVFPTADVTPKGVLPGVVFAAVGWTVLQALFQVYVRIGGQSETYGLLGGVLVLVTWLYFGGLLVLVGAVLNAVREGYAGRPDVAAGETHSPDETAAYLRSLREELTGRYEGMRESERSVSRLPHPDDRVDEVHVAESDAGNGAREGVRLHWTTRE